MSIGTGMMNLARQMYAAMDGILCTNDDLAVGVLQECLASGYRGAAGAGDRRFSWSGDWPDRHPRLASVLTPRYEMGKVATEILIKKIKGLPTIEKVDLPLSLSMGENHLILPERRRSPVSRTLTLRRLSPRKTGFLS
ncbi:Gluconate utilization system GNT-I transcriptional repressor [Raoultella planticola]|uniref:Gluconate utilization system GNT-I transcriptional repressor n=1 Tax=Raoultella planticola TaxID=575 RepID=A0A485BC21_RAOPL|nr:Gluconate utilization system GNT-I transcriptional repressor [Raoultella planticola]